MPRGYWPSRTKYGLVQITDKYAQDMATVHGILLKEIEQSVRYRNRLIQRRKDQPPLTAIETTHSLLILSSELRELILLRRRFYKRLRTAQRKLAAPLQRKGILIHG